MVAERRRPGGEHTVVDVADDDPADDWTRPGVYKVADGVYRIPLPLRSDALRAVNVYAITAGGDDLVLIDSGWAITEAREALVDALTAIGRGLPDVRRFLVTHVHQDHYTQAVALRREFGATVALGKGEQASLDVISGATPRVERAMFDRLRLAGATDLVARMTELVGPRRPDPNTWEGPDEWLSDQDVTTAGVRSLRAVATPGHTRGHLVYLDDAEALLFAGDHVLPHITPSIGFEAAPVEYPLRDYLDSLRLVRSMHDTRLLPAHGRVTPSTHARVDELLAHHDHRLAATEGFVAKGASTAHDVAGLLTWTRRQRTLAELDPFNETLAVLETMSHLDVLYLQGRLTRASLDGVHHYAVA
jgi:glyoxylase-like metal-dependent hydrolase (beta-lactamase superfamily II)